jgi:hypothetical protein
LRIHSYPVANGKTFHIAADFRYFAGELMTECKRLPGNKIANLAVAVIMDIRTANTGPSNPDECIACADQSHGAFFVPHIFRSV